MTERIDETERTRLGVDAALSRLPASTLRQHAELRQHGQIVGEPMMRDDQAAAKSVLGYLWCPSRCRC